MNIPDECVEVSRDVFDIAMGRVRVLLRERVSDIIIHKRYGDKVCGIMTCCDTRYWLHPLEVTNMTRHCIRCGVGLIQNAMPNLSADDRELLISGICGPCFDKMFPPEEE